MWAIGTGSEFKPVMSLQKTNQRSRRRLKERLRLLLSSHRPVLQRLSLLTGGIILTAQSCLLETSWLVKQRHFPCVKDSGRDVTLSGQRKKKADCHRFVFFFFCLQIKSQSLRATHSLWSLLYVRPWTQINQPCVMQLCLMEEGIGLAAHNDFDLHWFYHVVKICSLH